MSLSESEFLSDPVLQPSYPASKQLFSSLTLSDVFFAYTYPMSAPEPKRPLAGPPHSVLTLCPDTQIWDDGPVCGNMDLHGLTWCHELTIGLPAGFSCSHQTEDTGQYQAHWLSGIETSWVPCLSCRDGHQYGLCCFTACWATWVAVLCVGFNTCGPVGFCVSRQLAWWLFLLSV